MLAALAAGGSAALTGIGPTPVGFTAAFADGSAAVGVAAVVGGFADVGLAAVAVGAGAVPGAALAAVGTGPGTAPRFGDSPAAATGASAETGVFPGGVEGAAVTGVPLEAAA